MSNGTTTRLGTSAARFFRNRKAALGFGVVSFYLLLGLIGPVFLQDPTAFSGAPLEPPSAAHLFGTTGQGQDVLAQVAAGASYSVLLGFLVGISVVGIGAALGVTAGFFGGWTDSAISLVINVFLVIPALPLAVVLAAYLPPGPTSITLVLIFTGWAWNARVLRAQALALRNKEYVHAAIVSGESTLRILLVEMLPNMASLLASSVIGSTVFAIGAQVGLEFLGLGDSATITWGTNLYWAAIDAALLTGSWWTFVPTGLSVALVGFGLTLMNFGLDEITNPRLASERAWSQHLARAGLSWARSTPVVRS